MTPMLPPLSGAAISQSTLDNVQTQAGTVTASQTLNVVDVSDSTVGATTATGNSISGAVQYGSFNVQSTQSLTAAVSATTSLTPAPNVAANTGTQTSISTAATGNSGDAESVEAGPLTGTVTQTIGAGGSVTGATTITAPNAQTGAVSGSVQSLGNDQGIEVSDTSATMTVNQTNGGATLATGGISLNYTPGAATLTATSVSNNITGTGQGAASQTLTLNQTSSGQSVSEQDAYIGDGQAITGQATSTGNNISVSNTNGGLSVVESQTNTGYIQAQAQVSGYEYGSGEADAYAVANSALVGNVGPSLSLTNTQSNTGSFTGDGVVANATYSGTGSPGYDAYANATVMGNAVTGFACSDCNGTLAVSNSQTNSVNLAANATIDLAASNRSVSGTATAVGNNATFYVSKPSH